MIDWYSRRNELQAGEVFRSDWGIVKLVSRVPGDGTKWYVADWQDGWAYNDSTLEPGDLIGEPIPDSRAEIEAAQQEGW